jgi:molybdopterin-guanine dinucleotide biosynthesis protein A
MGGIDKGWQEYRGQPLIQHALERLRPQVDEVLISANRNLARYQQLGHPVVSDLQQGFPGPLAGILAAGRQASAPWLLVVPCDLPQLPLDLAWRLLNAAEQGSAQLAMAHDGVRSQQLCLLLQRRLLDDLDGYLACGERRVISWIERHSWAQADFSDRPQAFCNINHLTADTEALL